MALPSSGTLALSQIQSEYGGSNPISMSEYYRNGAYVPNSITTSVTVREPTSGYSYQSFAPTYIWAANDPAVNPSGSTVVAYIDWNNVRIYTGDGSFTGSSYTSGGYTYYKGVKQEDIYTKSGYLFTLYSIYRTYQSTTTIYVNQSVPTSGTISISNFYGGRKT